ncbi:hypothetical protein GCM10027615_11000 [Plantactinospora veratri]
MTHAGGGDADPAAGGLTAEVVRRPPRWSAGPLPTAGVVRRDYGGPGLTREVGQMGKTYDRIDGRLRTFIEQQKVFFVATAPLAADGHVNLSPKGLAGSLAVLDERTVAYLDFGGSGAETVAHLRENERITLMWCAFDGPPNIVRVHGRGEAVFRDDPGGRS